MIEYRVFTKRYTLNSYPSTSQPFQRRHRAGVLSQRGVSRFLQQLAAQSGYSCTRAVRAASAAGCNIRTGQKKLNAG